MGSHQRLSSYQDPTENIIYSILHPIKRIKRFQPRFTKKNKFTHPRISNKFRKMPMGLFTSPEALQQYMESILGNLEWLLIYIDDLLLMGKDIKDGLDKLEEVLVIIARFNAKFNLNKLFFLVKEFKYLGFILNQFGIALNPEKIGLLSNMLVPKTVKDIRSQASAFSFYRKLFRIWQVYLLH